QQLAHDFPQSGLLQALYARSTGGQDISHASTAFDTKALYVLINAYENLAEVSESQIIQQTSRANHIPAGNGQSHETPVSHDFNEEKIEEHTSVVVGDDEEGEVQAIDQ